MPASSSTRPLLVFSHAFPPVGGGGVQRTLKFCKYLPANGWLPTVITSSRLRGVPDDEPLDELDPAVRIRRVGELPTSRAWAAAVAAANHWSALSWMPSVVWPDPSVGWLPGAVRAGLKAAGEQRPDAIFSSSSPFTAHLAASIVQRRTGVPWIADFRDDFARNEWVERPAPLRRLSLEVEGRLCGRAAAVVSVAPELQIGSDLPAGKNPRVTVIPNGVDLADFSGSQAVAGNSPDRLAISYVGTLYGRRLAAAQALLDGLEIAAMRGLPIDHLELRLVGEIEKIDVPPGLPVTRVGSVSHREAIGEMRSATALLLIVSDDRYATTVPAKAYEYLAARRPILALARSESKSAELIRSAGTGWVVRPGDSEGAAAALLEMHTAWRAGKLAEPTALPTELTELNREAQARRLSALLDEVAGP